MATTLDKLAPLAGPLALAGLFLPWFHADGVLAGYAFDARDVFRLGSVLDGLALPAPGVALAWGMQVAAVGAAVSAVWLLVLAGRRDHALHRLARAFLALAVVAGVTIGLMLGYQVGSGLALTGLAAVLAAGIPRPRGDRPTSG